MDPSDPALEIRRRRLIFRAWHRGIREADLILGRFADAYAAQFTVAEIESFEALLEIPDRDLLAWVTGEVDLPSGRQSAMLARIVAFHRPAAEETRG